MHIVANITTTLHNYTFKKVTWGHDSVVASSQNELGLIPTVLNIPVGILETRSPNPPTCSLTTTCVCIYCKAL